MMFLGVYVSGGTSAQQCPLSAPLAVAMAVPEQPLATMLMSRMYSQDTPRQRKAGGGPKGSKVRNKAVRKQQTDPVLLRCDCNVCT